MDPASPRPPGARAHAAWAAACVIVAALVVLGLDAFGRSRRSAPARPRGRGPEVIVATRPADAIAAWRARGLRGRALVHFGRFLHFVPDGGTTLLARELLHAGAGARADDALAAEAGRLDYLWTAEALGLVRNIHYVSPPGALATRATSLPGGGALPARIDLESWPRSIDRVPPRLDEPVVVDVGASWFDELTADDLFALLESSGLRADLVTVELSAGSDDVSEAARAAARGLARRLADGGSP